MNRANQIFKAMSDSHRLNLLETLCVCGCEQTVSELDGCCDIDLSVISRHLAQLRDAGLVTADRRGRSVFYSADPTEIASVLRDLADAFEACGKSSCCCVSSYENKNQTKENKTNE